jgi:O-methyltransferase
MAPRSDGTSLLALVRRVLGSTAHNNRPDYVFESDGLATVHYSPFLNDAAFNKGYFEMRREWFPYADVDVRWRMWMLTTVARHCSALDGDFAEFGVYRAGCAFMILVTGAFADSKRFFLFDTFAGIPAGELTTSEIAAGLAGAHGDTSVDYVHRRLERWSSQIVLVPGDVRTTTVRETETSKLAFVHMDLNASEPTRVALEYAFPRLATGAVMLFDDYGWTGLEAQRDVIDAFLADKPEQIMALPTGQALLVKQ